MASMSKFNTWINYLQGNVASHTVTWKASGGNAIKCALTPTANAPVATNVKYSDLTPIGAGNGYTAGGAACTCGDKSLSTATLAYPLTVASPTWTSATGDMAAFQYIVFYDDDAGADKPLIGWYDYTSALTLHGANGDTFTVTLTGGNLFTMT